jgi:hypothetical protein
VASDPNKQAPVKPAEKPEWWDEEKGEWGENQANAYATLEEVLGRPITANEQSGIQAWGHYYDDHGYQGTAAMVAMSDEARMRGVKPGDFYNTAIDPATLSEEEKPWYEEWKKNNKGPFYNTVREQLSWKQRLFSLDVYRGMNDGSITVDNGVTTVTQDAIDRYGQGLFFYNGDNGGQIIRAPAGTSDKFRIQERQQFEMEKPDSWKQEDWDKWKAEQTAGGYELFNTQPDQQYGVAGQLDDLMTDLDFGSDLRNGIKFNLSSLGNPSLAAESFEDLGAGDFSYFITDPLGVTSGSTFGTKGPGLNFSGTHKATGASANDIRNTQMAGQAVITAVATYYGGPAGTAIALGLPTMVSASQAASGQQSWEDFWTRLGITYAASRLGASSPLAGWGNVAYNAGIQAASAGAQSYLLSRDPKTGERTYSASDAFQAAGAAGVTSLLSGTANAFIGASSAGNGFLTGAAVGVGSNIAGQAITGEEIDWTTAATAGLQGGLTEAAAAEKRGQAIAAYAKDPQGNAKPPEGFGERVGSFFGTPGIGRLKIQDDIAAIKKGTPAAIRGLKTAGRATWDAVTSPGETFGHIADASVAALNGLKAAPGVFANAAQAAVSHAAERFSAAVDQSASGNTGSGFFAGVSRGFHNARPRLAAAR